MAIYTQDSYKSGNSKNSGNVRENDEKSGKIVIFTKSLENFISFALFCIKLALIWLSKQLPIPLAMPTDDGGADSNYRAWVWSCFKIK